MAVGAAFGVPAPAALALAVVKRGRELLVGAPAIVAWVIAERHSIATFWSRRYMKERRRVERAVTSPSLTVMRRAPRLRVGVLVDLYWSPTAGGHVKTWERLAATATEAGEEIDLTVHFLGDRNATHPLGPHVRYQIHPPLFSSARLPFLSDMPGHTDLGAPQSVADVPAAGLRRHPHHRRDVRFRPNGRAGVALARHSAHQLGAHHDALLHAGVHRRHRQAPRRLGSAVAAAPRPLGRRPGRRGAHATPARRPPPPLRLRPRVAGRRPRAARRPARARTGGPAPPGDRARPLQPGSARPRLAVDDVRDPARPTGGDLRGPPGRHQERARAGARGPPARRSGGRSAPLLRGQGTRIATR